MTLYAGYGGNIVLNDADGLVMNRSQDPRVVIRGGRLCLDRFRRWISGASAGCRCGVPFSERHAGRA